MRLGFGEILVILVLALLFFGPSKLPQLGSSLGQALRGFKKGLNELHNDEEASAQEAPKGLPGEVAGRPAPTTNSTASTPAEKRV